MSFSSRKLQQELLAIKQQQELLEKEQKLEQQRQEQEVERHRREQQLPPLRGKDRGRESKRHQGKRWISSLIFSWWSFRKEPDKEWN